MKFVLYETLYLGVALALTLVAHGPADAQWRDALREANTRAYPEVGLRGGYDFDGGQGSVGAHLRIPMGRSGRVELVPSADVFLGDGDAEWQANADAVIRMGPMRGLYAGGGVALVEGIVDGEEGTEVGWNLLAGFEAPGLGAPVRPFVEGRWTFVEDEEPFRLVFGVNVPFGRGLW